MRLYLLEELEDGRGLAGSRRPETEGVHGAGSLKSRPNRELEAVHLGFPVVEVLWHIVKLKEIPVLEQRLLPQKHVGLHAFSKRFFTRSVYFVSPSSIWRSL